MPSAPRPMSLWQRLALRFPSLYPPFLGAGIRIRRIDAEAGPIYEVEMPLRFYNRNFVGTHFGGSLYTMCDPFYMMILIERLGRGYVVWDKTATIRFLRPGRGRVTARFEVPEARIEEIRRQAAGGVVEPVFTAEVADPEGRVVAQVEKRLYVRAEERPEPGHQGG